MQAIGMHLNSKSNRLVQNILITLRNLSDAATQIDHLEELLKSLLQLLSSSDLQIVGYVMGILRNLTCNNPSNKVGVSLQFGRGTLTH